MEFLNLSGIRKTYGEVVATERLDLGIKKGEFLVLVGPSGCGKTTILRMIAGLETPSEGEIQLDSEIITRCSPRDRDVAMVFQNYALYPHMNVRKNLSFGLRMRGVSKSTYETRVREVSQVLDIEELLDRYPSQLSGGQRQRVALGRAIIRKPKLFLMDEPLSNLDTELRISMRAELLRLHMQLGVTTLYVTHDQVEAMTLGDRLVVLNHGRVEQVGTPEEIYRSPRSVFVARFLGSPQINLLSVPLKASEDGFQVLIGNKRIPIASDCFLTSPTNADETKKGERNGEKQILAGIRPEGLIVEAETGSESFQGVVELVENLGKEKVLFVRLKDQVQVLQAITRPDSHHTKGMTVRLTIQPGEVHLFDPQTKMALLVEPI